VLDASTNHCLKDSFHIAVSNASLPVTITSFNAVAGHDKVFLNWTTSQEQQNKYFTIERSGDGTHFGFLNRINGAGTTTEAKTYNTVDHTPLEGPNFYRLSQTDIDGSIKYHGIKMVNFKSIRGFSAGIISKGNNRVSVMINSKTAATVHMNLVDMNGKIILQERVQVLNGGTTKDIYVIRGIYILVMRNIETGESISNKFIVH
jgi:hypothetical protein